MAIAINKSEKKNLLHPMDPKKWYVHNKSFGTITEKELARKVANRTALNRKEVEMALYLLREILLEELLNGYTVKISDWGYFYLTLKSEGALTKEEATANKIKKVRLHLRHDKSFEDELQKATFIPIESLTIKEKP